MRKTTRLRELFYRPEILVLPGVCNALQARMVQAAGFEACYMSGGGTANSLVGVPDAGLVTLTEMVLNAGYIASAIDIPLLSDADTGYGNALNVRHAIQRFIQAGVAGVHLEDQVFPKRCGHVAGIELIAIEEAVGKYRAAMDAKRELDPDFVVVARTDARHAAGGGLAEAIRRAQAYRREAGVDALYFAGPESREEMAAFVSAVREVDPEVPIMGDTFAVQPPPTWEELQALGYAVAFYPGAAFAVANVATWDYLHDFRRRGVQALIEFQERTRGHPLANFGINDLLGFPQLRALEERYLPPERLTKYERSRGIYTP
ncbi:MAG TPA: isocitrate lyase/PEP mutase family protein [Chloroflexota bacterium]|nr:isocitrate lyase/PEP mutase family protein [Chloroflexota bacterium]